MSDFFITPIWDTEAGVFYSESNIKGLHIEASSLPEFFEIAADVAEDLIQANHKPARVSKEPSLVFRSVPAAATL